MLLVLVPVSMLAGFVASILGYFHGLHAVGALGTRLLPESLNPTLRRLLAVSAAVVVLFLVGIVLPGLSMLLSFIALGLGFGMLGLRLWKGCHRYRQHRKSKRSGSGLTLTLSCACHLSAVHEKSPAAAMQAGLFAGLGSRGD